MTRIPTDLSVLQRASGAFAMLAIDQRESLRAMYSQARSVQTSDEDLVRFKLDALRALTPHASAVLVDQDLGWRPAIEAAVVSRDCGLIASFDCFSSSGTEIVAKVEIDNRVEASTLKQQGAKALKLLVIWRPDESREKRIEMVDEFVRRCREADLISIIEPVSRAPANGDKSDLTDGMIQAAKELGQRGQDIYKSEVPFFGHASEREMRDQLHLLDNSIESPWVILSSGVHSDAFPVALDLACKEGASGFLAGRAVWKDSLPSKDIAHSLKTEGVERLKRLCDVVDAAVGR
jgi:sulfofructosephosphate aldolase